jgi:hypothetical protein
MRGIEPQPCSAGPKRDLNNAEEPQRGVKNPTPILNLQFPFLPFLTLILSKRPFFQIEHRNARR